MDEAFRKELEESISYWEEHLKDAKYLHSDGRETRMFDELLSPEEIERILGE